ncbi:hypothetical protein IWZ01DRAFT_478860 [Phyllosticta capitalensis]
MSVLSCKKTFLRSNDTLRHREKEILIKGMMGVLKSGTGGRKRMLKSAPRGNKVYLSSSALTQVVVAVTAFAAENDLGASPQRRAIQQGGELLLYQRTPEQSITRHLPYPRLRNSHALVPVAKAPL